MSVENIKNNRKEVGEDIVFNIPNDGKVYNANWHDDIVVDQADDENESLGFEEYNNEADYDSSKVKESAEADRKIELFSKSRLRNIGHRALKLTKIA